MRGLRPLADREEGSGIKRLPNGVYGFASSSGAGEIPLFRKGTVALVGFVSAEMAVRMDSSPEEFDLNLLPEPEAQISSLVSISLSRIGRIQAHSIREGKGLQLRLKPASRAVA
jgi:hypothetical protein